MSYGNTYGNTYNNRPTVGDRVEAAFSDRTAEQIHYEKQAGRAGGVPTSVGQQYVNSEGVNTTMAPGMYPGGYHNRATYDQTAMPTVGDQLHSAVSTRTAQQIHEDNRARDFQGGGVGMGGGVVPMAAGTQTYGHTVQPNNSTSFSCTGAHNSAAYDATSKPTLGDKLKACLSVRTAHQIHEDNRAKDLGYAPGGVGGSGVGVHNRSTYDASAQPSVGDYMHAAVSERTAQEIHEDNRARDIGRQNTINTAGTGWHGEGRHNTRGYDATNNPTIGDHLHAAVSNRTAQEIHDDNRAKDLNPNRTDVYGTGRTAYDQQILAESKRNY